IDIVCDGCALPFASKSVGALILLDVLHHVPRPLQFMKEAERVLKPGGRLVMIEPWITPFSYVLYRYFHHEDCSLSINIELPFGSGKEAYSGNAAIPFKTLRYLEKGNKGLRPLMMKRFIGFPYLATLGFQRVNSVPSGILRFARFVERFSRPLTPLAA